MKALAALLLLLPTLAFAQGRKPAAGSGGSSVVTAVTAANGLTLTTGTLALSAAGAAAAGSVTTGTQTIAGAKTFTGAHVLTSTLDMQGVVSSSTGNVTITDALDITGATGITGVLTNTGNILPGTTATYNLGSSSARWSSVFAGAYADSGGVSRVTTAANSATTYLGNQANGATAVGHKFGASTSLTTAGALIAQFGPDSSATLKASIDIDGSYRHAVSNTLQTCASGIEGLIARQSGGTSGVRTKLCFCTSDGGGSPAYAWKNISDIFALDSSSVGTTTTCP